MAAIYRVLLVSNRIAAGATMISAGGPLGAVGQQHRFGRVAGVADMGDSVLLRRRRGYYRPDNASRDGCAAGRAPGCGVDARSGKTIEYG